MKKQTPGRRLIAGMTDAVRYMEGEATGVRVSTVKVPELSVKKIREALKLTQSQFALKFGFAPASVRNWEQGRNRPDGAARVLLAVIARHPEAVEDALSPESEKLIDVLTN